MPRFNIFAKRQEEIQDAGPRSKNIYDDLPEPFRVQVVWILRDLVGFPDYKNPRHVFDRFTIEFWETARNTLAKELGRFSLGSQMQRAGDDCLEFLMNEPDVAKVLSLIEICCRLAENHDAASQEYPSVDDAINELNERFIEHGLGYQYQAGVIVMTDSQYLHDAAVEPAFALLQDPNFSGPLQEFMEAHAHYRKGELKEAITDAGNALESTMKAICSFRGWNYDPKRSNASALITILFQNNLIPSEIQTHFNALRSTLESGVPTVRNQAGRGAHGAGSTPVDVPRYIAHYCLNLTATAIVFLLEAHNSTTGR